jgi:hypothetical protein
MNMLATIVPKSDQLNADDLIGRTLTIEVTEVTINPGSEQPVAIHFKGDKGKPYRPGLSMRRVLVKAWGPDASTYAGRSMTLYRSEGVRFGGLEVGGIRISHMSHLDGKLVMALTEKKGSKKAFEVKPLVAEQRTDKASVAAHDLIKRIEGADSLAALEAITSEETVVKQRAWLGEKRPELASDVNDAVAEALARMEPSQDGEPRGEAA